MYTCVCVCVYGGGRGRDACLSACGEEGGRGGSGRDSVRGGARQKERERESKSERDAHGGGTHRTADTAFVFLCATGLLRSIVASKEARIALVPVDTCVNYLIVAGWNVAARGKRGLVHNNTGTAPILVTRPCMFHHHAVLHSCGSMAALGTFNPHIHAHTHARAYGLAWWGASCPYHNLGTRACV